MYPARIESYGTFMKYAPLWVYLAVYIFTCLAAAIPFFFGYSPFLILVDYFSGTAVPASFTLEQTVVILALFLGAPALFTLGYFGSMRVGVRVWATVSRACNGKNGEPNTAVSKWLPVFVFLFAVSAGVYDLARAGAFAKLKMWGSYGDWVQARWTLFSALGYFSFVNLYLVVPVSAAWVILTFHGNEVLWRVVRLFVLLIVCLLAFFLFQKKALLVNCVLIFSVLFIYRVRFGEWSGRQTWLLVGATTLILAVYFILVVLPVYSEASKTAEQVLTNSEPKQGVVAVEKDLKVSKELDQAGANQGPADLNQKRSVALHSVLGSSRNMHLLAYTLLAPVTRTAAPAMFYPIVFPDTHAYYGLDFGQDILGYGSMPDDNRVVWNYMYPELPGGSVMVPFQFALYSQVGILGALVFSGLLGALVSLCWQTLFLIKLNPVWRSLAGGVFILFSIYIAMDSVRNSVVSSYGVMWAWLFVALMFFIDRLLSLANRKFRPDCF